MAVKRRGGATISLIKTKKRSGVTPAATRTRHLRLLSARGKEKPVTISDPSQDRLPAPVPCQLPSSHRSAVLNPDPTIREVEIAASNPVSLPLALSPTTALARSVYWLYAIERGDRPRIRVGR
jgi:hypothetical protein